jgi:hypothetical protein
MVPERVFVASFVAACVGTAALNVVVDPFGAIQTGWFEPVTMSARRAKVQLASAVESPEHLILGSSRLMQIDTAQLSGYLGGGEVFNASVLVARAEDNLAMWRHLNQDLGWQPKTVILGLDWFAFHDTEPTDVRTRDVAVLRRHLSLGPDPSRMAAMLLGWGTTRFSVTSVYRAASGTPSSFRWHRDGTLHRTALDGRIASGEDVFEASVSPIFREYRHRYEGFEGLSSERVKHFDALLDDFAAQGVTTHLLVLPNHQRLTEHLAEHTTAVDRRTEVMAMVQKRVTSGVLVHDMSNIKAWHGDPDGFYDPVHLTPENVTTLVDAVWGQ